jgi:simple sugar transport system ATP-binding protein
MTERRQTAVFREFKRGEIAIELKGITKRYPGGVLANDGIDLQMRAGEIHGILGENGAGKTTLMRILAGEIEPDEGEIHIGGGKVEIRSPHDARNLSIGMVHQQRKLIPKFSVIENILLGDPGTGALPNVEKSKKKVGALSDKFDFKVDLDAQLWQLDAGEAQIVEILKVLYSGANIVIMDEPTAGLSPMQQEKLLASLKKMAREGLTIVPFVTHKLPIVTELCDRITVLRNGKVITTTDSGKAWSKEELTVWMVGKKVDFDLEKPETELDSILLEVKDLSAISDQGVPALKNVSFSVREGEILGIAGVAGNGQDELAEVLTGLRKPSEGTIIFRGEDITHASIKKRRELGMAYRSADVLERGVIGDFSILENFVLSSLYTQDFCRGMLIDVECARGIAETEFSNFEIRAPSINTMAKNLSGGNLSKLILALEFSWNSKFLIDQLVTQGLDVATTEYIRKRLFEAKKEKKAILLFSKDLDEIIMMSDRIAPIYEGVLGEPIPSKNVDKMEIGAAITGKRM